MESLYFRSGENTLCCVTLFTPSVGLTSSRCASELALSSASANLHRLAVNTAPEMKTRGAEWFAMREGRTLPFAQYSLINLQHEPGQPFAAQQYNLQELGQPGDVFETKVVGNMIGAGGDRDIHTIFARVQSVYDHESYQKKVRTNQIPTTFLFNDPYNILIETINSKFKYFRPKSRMCKFGSDGKPFDGVSLVNIKPGQYFIPITDEKSGVTECFLEDIVHAGMMQHEGERRVIDQFTARGRRELTLQQQLAAFYLFTFKGRKIPANLHNSLSMSNLLKHMGPRQTFVRLPPSQDQEFDASHAYDELQLGDFELSIRASDKENRCNEGTSQEDVVVDRGIHVHIPHRFMPLYKAHLPADENIRNSRILRTLDYSGGLVFYRQKIPDVLDMQDQLYLLGVLDDEARDPDATTLRMLPIQDALLQRCLRHESAPQDSIDRMDDRFHFDTNVFEENLKCGVEMAMDANDDYAVRDDFCPHSWITGKTDRNVVAQWYRVGSLYEADEDYENDEKYESDGIGVTYGHAGLLLVADREGFRIPTYAPAKTVDARHKCRALDGILGDAMKALNEDKRFEKASTLQAALHLTFLQMTPTFERHGNQYRCLTPTVFRISDMMAPCIRINPTLRPYDANVENDAYAPVVLFFDECVMHEITVNFRLVEVVDKTKSSREHHFLNPQHYLHTHNPASMHYMLRRAVYSDQLDCKSASLARSDDEACSMNVLLPPIYSIIETRDGSEVNFGSTDSYAIFARGMCSIATPDASAYRSLPIANAYSSRDRVPFTYTWTFHPDSAHRVCGHLQTIQRDSLHRTAEYNALIAAFAINDDPCVHTAIESPPTIMLPAIKQTSGFRANCGKTSASAAYQAYGFHLYGALNGHGVVGSVCEKAACARERRIFEHLCVQVSSLRYMYVDWCFGISLEYVGYIDELHPTFSAISPPNLLFRAAEREYDDGATCPEEGGQLDVRNPFDLSAAPDAEANRPLTREQLRNVRADYYDAKSNYAKRMLLVQLLMEKVASLLESLHKQCVVHNNLNEQSLVLIRQDESGSDRLVAKSFASMVAGLQRDEDVRALAASLTIRLKGFGDSVLFQTLTQSRVRGGCTPDMDVNVKSDDPSLEVAKGTPRTEGVYMSGVLRRDGRRRDVFMLGVLAYKLLYGAHPTFRKQLGAEKKTCDADTYYQVTDLIASDIYYRPKHKLCLPKQPYRGADAFLLDALSDTGLSASKARELLEEGARASRASCASPSSNTGSRRRRTSECDGATKADDHDAIVDAHIAGLVHQTSLKQFAAMLREKMLPPEDKAFQHHFEMDGFNEILNDGVFTQALQLCNADNSILSPWPPFDSVECDTLPKFCMGEVILVLSNECMKEMRYRMNDDFMGGVRHCSPAGERNCVRHSFRQDQLDQFTAHIDTSERCQGPERNEIVFSDPIPLDRLRAVWVCNAPEICALRADVAKGEMRYQKLPIRPDDIVAKARDLLDANGYSDILVYKTSTQRAV